MAQGKHQYLTFWGGDFVQTTEDVENKYRVFQKGAVFQIELNRGKIVACPDEAVTLHYSYRKEKRGVFKRQTGSVEVPAKYLQRVVDVNDYTTESSESISIRSTCSGGLCSPK